VSAKNRKGLEKLCRYIARPPLAKSRLLEDGDGEYRILLKTPWSDGTSSIQVGLLELMVTERSGVGEFRTKRARSERNVWNRMAVGGDYSPAENPSLLYHGVFAPRSPVYKGNQEKEVLSDTKWSG
jgi:hypothetical protein